MEKQIRRWSPVENNKGLSCPFKPITCQEGVCFGCAVWQWACQYLCRDFDGARDSRKRQHDGYGNEYWERLKYLEKAIRLNDMLPDWVNFHELPQAVGSSPEGFHEE